MSMKLELTLTNEDYNLIWKSWNTWLEANQESKMSFNAWCLENMKDAIHDVIADIEGP